MSVPRWLFLQARNAVEAKKSFAPVLSGVFRESSRTVCFLAFSRIVLNSASAQMDRQKNGGHREAASE